MQRELGQAALSVLLSDKQAQAAQQIQSEVEGKAKEIGFEVTEVRFHRVDLQLETSQAIYERMKSDRKRTVILSEAQRPAKITHGEGPASANQILANAFDKNPKFYHFYRSLRTYRQSLAESAPTIFFCDPNLKFAAISTTGLVRHHAHDARHA